VLLLRGHKIFAHALYYLTVTLNAALGALLDVPAALTAVTVIE